MADPGALPEAPRGYPDLVVRAANAARELLGALEHVARRLHPPELPLLRAELVGPAEAAEAARADLEAAPPPEGLEPFHTRLLAGLGYVLEAATRLRGAAGPEAGIAAVLAGFAAQCRALEALYPLRRALPALGVVFAEPAWHARLAELDPPPSAGVAVGVHEAPGGEDGRGGFHLYVPERCDGRTPRPLVVALHGGFGHGRDFLWTWLREARSRNCLLLAPTSRGPTWSLDAPRLDAAALRSMLAYVGERWPVDRERVLLTGLSDGATFALLAGLETDAPYSALAPVAGVLHPLHFRLGNLGRAEGRRIYQVHGALDWVFPVGLARRARDALAAAGADLTYRELADLSHAYPREENARILDWLGAGAGEEGDEVHAA